MTLNKVALVTGSGKNRIGRHVAEALAQRGYTVIIHYRNSKSAAFEAVAALLQQNLKAIAIQADLDHEDEIQAMIQRTLKQFGRIDVLVNCAAIWPRKSIEVVNAQDLRDAFETNTLATFLCCQQAGLTMIQQSDGGCIVNLGDWATCRPYLHHAAYFVSKGSIPTLTRSLAVEFGSRNPSVRVNCILPGPVLLPEEMLEKERQRIIQATLVKREGKPDHIVQAVLFFIDNDFTTGVCLPVDGGRSIFSPDTLD